MCGFCAAADLADPCGKDHLGSIQANLGTIALTIPDNTSSTETITIGGTRDETLETLGDQDWFRIDLTAGDTIQIDLFGLDHDTGNGLGALEDPYVRVYNASGVELAENDDIVLGAIRDSRLVFNATDTGTYFIEVDSYRSEYVGDYRLQVSTPAPASPVDSIQTGFTLNTNDPVLVYFGQPGDTYAYNGDVYTATGVNAYEQAQLFSVFEGVEEFIDIDFQITTNRAAADLEWATDTLPSGNGGTLLGFFFFPSSSGNGGYGVLNNNSGSFPSWNSSPGGTLDTGGFMYGVAVHELGHGLGLGHTHDTGGGSEIMQGVSSSSDRGSLGLNSSPFTAMSYNEGWADSPSGLASSVASTGQGATFGALDIAALQNMYGANTTHAAGDDVYDLFDSNATGSGAGYYATWDTGGVDEFRYTGSKDAFIDLREATLQYDAGGGGFMSHVDGVIAGRTIANGVVIENATSGSGADTLQGNDADNRLIGNAGDDLLTGGAGIDTFVFSFGDGFDSIADFELGIDLIDLRGLGLGFADLSITQSGNTANVQYDFSTNGVVSLTDVDSAALTADSFLLDVTGPVPITGTENGDSLDGTSGDDEIIGLGGNDTITALDGNDSIDAGTGDDTIIYTSGQDTIDGGTGSDWLDLRGVTSDANFSLLTNVSINGTPVDVQNVENLLLSDVGNTAHGDDNANTILGGAGDDTIVAHGGNDSADGGAGNDILSLHDGTTNATDPDYAIDLGAGTATGSNGEVNTFQNFETVVGGGGDDSFTGTAANEVMGGGAGSDTFAFNYGDGFDTITDFAVGTDLIDLSGLSIGFTNLSIKESGGNAVVTYDFATSGAITLTGVTAASLAESDFILDVNAASQPAPGAQVTGSASADNLAGTAAPEELVGLGGNDILNGRAGADTLIGGAGNDNYYLDELGDTVVEQAGEGYDRTYSSVSFTLADHVEAGATLGTEAMNISGNDLVNWITGNAASNGLNGGEGNDRLISYGGDDRLNGDGGNDVLEGGTGADIFAFDAGAGTDVITDFEVGIDLIDVSSLGIAYAEMAIVQSGTRAIVVWDDPSGGRGVVVVNDTLATSLLLDSFVTVFGAEQPAILGTSGADVIIGSQIGDDIQGLAGNDLLNGGLGDDTLNGGTGDDSYYVDQAGDTVLEAAGEGLDRIYASIDFTISANVENISATGSSAVSFTGNAAVNWMTGNAASNVLSGLAGNDRLQGVDGADTLIGGTGNDLLEGGADADVFRFNQGDGTDTILDWQDGVDLIDVSSLGGTFADLRIVDSGLNTIIFYDETDPTDRGLVVVNGHSASDFTADDFIFV